MKRISKLSLLSIFLANSIFLTNCSKDEPISPIKENNIVSNTNFTAEDSFFYEIDVIGHVGLNLEAINGGIVITEIFGANSVKIIGVKQVKSESTEDAKAQLKELTVDMQDLTDKVFVKTMQPGFFGGRSYIVNYTITLPHDMEIDVNSRNGQITLNGIHGNVFVDLINGNIEGEVTLPLDGTIDMGIANGNIDLDIPRNTSAEFTARVANGNISVSNLELQSRVTTSKSLTGTLGDGRGIISLNISNGEILVRGF
jgi:hypothetical protein